MLRPRLLIWATFKGRRSSTGASAKRRTRKSPFSIFHSLHHFFFPRLHSSTALVESFLLLGIQQRSHSLLSLLPKCFKLGKHFRMERFYFLPLLLKDFSNLGTLFFIEIKLFSEKI